MRNVIAALVVGISVAAWAAPRYTPNPDLDAQIETLRADTRAKKTDVVSQSMQLSPEESQKFWDVYRRYEADKSKLNDERIALVKEYNHTGGSLTDEGAQRLSEKSFELDGRAADLKKRYFHLMTKEVSPVTAAKFFQLDHRLDLITDLEMAKELPPVLDKAPEGQ